MEMATGQPLIFVCILRDQGCQKVLLVEKGSYGLAMGRFGIAGRVAIHVFCVEASDRAEDEERTFQ